VGLGDRVEVPLGRGDRMVAGVVVRLGGAELLEGLAPEKVKRIARRTGTGLPADLLPLAEWMADYYVCPLGMVLAALMPAAVKRRVGLERAEELRPALEGGEAERGLVEALPTRLRKAWTAVRGAEIDWPVTARGLAASVAGVSRASVGKFIEAGLLTREERDVVRASGRVAGAGGGGGGDLARPGVAGPALTEEQARAVGAIGSGESLARFGVHLLLGVTGSGKTEVYLRVLELVLAAGRTAIVLVPEIALTPQTSRRFTDRFGAGRVAVLHSGLSASQRHAQWAAASEGRVRVVVGARSAVFAPLADLGLVVVDEEHDSSYKQDQLPRYHARDVAIKRAQLAGCPVVLGSATPALETYANAIGWAGTGGGSGGSGTAGGARAKYAMHRLTVRATGAKMPTVEIVDLAQEQRERASGEMGQDRYVHLLGPRLERALRQTLVEGHQAILLLNRRGYANYICCPDQRCGWLMHCVDCDATMVYHKALVEGVERGFVRCHHCLAEQLLPKLCPACGKRVNTFGEGTQRLEEELERKFNAEFGLKIDSTLLRLDSDTMRSASDYFTALDSFARGTARVLVGTQMLAKGLDFPGVKLVGVVNADTALNMPDFRSSERTYQLVSQVAGRAGRGSLPGRVIVQTRSPEALAIKLAARHDFEEFARQELVTRARAGVPPATRMARVVCRDRELAKALRAASELAGAVRAAAVELGLPKGQPVLRGPAPCPFARIAQHHRVELQVIAANRGVVQALLQRVRGLGLLKSDAHTAVDVDPVALL
jgi:primosomal protein N' (replication factor Y) (superfamily II helicase)